MLNEIIRFKIHIQSSLEGYEEFVADEVERECSEQASQSQQQQLQQRLRRESEGGGDGVEGKEEEEGDERKEESDEEMGGVEDPFAA